jgi:tetratricopeptide (TPR) repeat protein
MKSLTLMLAVLLSGLPSAGAQPDRELHGRIFHVGKHGEKVPEAGIVVTLQETGNSRDTNDQGIFRLPLPPAFQPGGRVTLGIDKPGWRIRFPLDGEALIPSSSPELVEVELLPVGSKLFWTDDRIEKLVRDLADKAKRDIDFSRYIQEWAVRFGFTPEDAQKEIDRWVAQVEENQEDLYRLGLAAVAKKRFTDAARHFRDSAEWDARQLAETRRRKEELVEREKIWSEKLVRDLVLKGKAYSWSNDYQKAFESFEEAHRHTSRTETPQLWASTLLRVALIRTYLGTEGPLAERAAEFEQIIQAFRQVLDPSGRQPCSDWVEIQRNLGVALNELGQLTGSEWGAQLFAESVEAYRQTLHVYTREQSPWDWGAIQISLGNALAEQGARTEGESGARLLAEAVEAHRQALRVFTREQFPQEWAMTQEDLCTDLREQGRRTEGERSLALLAASVEACRQALLALPREQSPQNWAAFQGNLSGALLEQGKQTEGEPGAQLLALSMEACRQAFRVHSREQLPQKWAFSQADLGNILLAQGGRTEGEPGVQLLAESAEAYRQALSIDIREIFPEMWAKFQNILGSILLEQARRTGGERSAQLLTDAIRAYRSARDVYAYDRFPREWISCRSNEVRALLLSARYQEAAEGLSEILDKDPDIAKVAVFPYRRLVRFFRILESQGHNSVLQGL